MGVSFAATCRVTLIVRYLSYALIGRSASGGSTDIIALWMPRAAPSIYLRRRLRIRKASV